MRGEKLKANHEGINVEHEGYELPRHEGTLMPSWSVLGFLPLMFRLLT